MLQDNLLTLSAVLNPISPAIGRGGLFRLPRRGVGSSMGVGGRREEASFRCVAPVFRSS